MGMVGTSSPFPEMQGESRLALDYKADEIITNLISLLTLLRRSKKAKPAKQWKKPIAEVAWFDARAKTGRTPNPGTLR
jgi:hypothetical protein